MKHIKYRDLLESLKSFTEEQLDQLANVAPVEQPLVPVGGIWIVEEDHINPSGDGAEPVSSYKNDPDFESNYADEPIVLKKGTVLIFGTE